MVNKRKAIRDLVLNIIATVIPILILQVIIYPLVSKKGSEVYGTMITVVSGVTLVCNTLGNVLNNVRLLYDEKYSKQNLVGDFNIIFLAEAAIGLLIVLIVQFIMFPKATKVDVILVSIIGMLIQAYAYYSVTFRISLDYKAVLITNFVLGIGYGIGCILFYLTDKWEWTYIMGYCAALTYILAKSDLWKEKLCFTPLFKETLKNTLLLLASGILYSLLNYADKLIIYPLIGAEAVSIYYIASIFGKIVSMAVSPLNSLMLSYLAKWEKISLKFVGFLVILSGIVVAIGYGMCMVLAHPVLKLLYPQYVEQAMLYMPITSLIAMATMLVSVYYPFILKFCEMKWQVVIDGVALVFYVIFCVFFFRLYGMYGFCVGVLLAFAIKFLVMLIILIKGVKNDSKEHKKN